MGLLSTLLDCSKTFHKNIDFADSVIRNLPSVIHVQPSKFHFSKLQLPAVGHSPECDSYTYPIIVTQ